MKEILKLNPLIDEYIAKAEPFARPILETIRRAIHRNCPDVEEDIKWATPHFSYKNDYMIVLAAYKKHCAFSIFKAQLIEDPIISKAVSDGKNFGPYDKLTSVAQLPDNDQLDSLIKQAMLINERGLKKPNVKVKVEKPATIEMPGAFQKALDENPKAKEVFDLKSASFRKEYLVWISSAKTDATRDARITESIEWISEGKSRFWQYKK